MNPHGTAASGVHQLVIATSITWETDGEVVDLPTSVVIPKDLEREEIADYLSDRFGFLVLSFDTAAAAATAAATIKIEGHPENLHGDVEVTTRESGEPSGDEDDEENPHQAMPPGDEDDEEEVDDDDEVFIYFLLYRMSEYSTNLMLLLNDFYRNIRQYFATIEQLITTSSSLGTTRTSCGRKLSARSSTTKTA